MSEGPAQHKPLTIFLSRLVPGPMACDVPGCPSWPWLSVRTTYEDAHTHVTALCREHALNFMRGLLEAW